jgi:hypothetical protein
VVSEPRVPAVEVWHGTATPAELSEFAQTRASARDDLNTLIAGWLAASRAVGDEHRDRLVARYVLGLYEWEHLHLALALTAALERLENIHAGRA